MKVSLDNAALDRLRSALAQLKARISLDHFSTRNLQDEDALPMLEQFREELDSFDKENGRHLSRRQSVFICFLACTS